MRNLLDFMTITDKYISYLKDRGVEFDKNGFPILKKELFLNEEPSIIVPYYNRNNKKVKDRKKTVLCFYVPDEDIYPRFKNIFNEFDIYKQYLGVAIPDITVTADMDVEWQETIVLINCLFGAVLAVNDIKIILNTRVGISKLELFNNYPKNVMCISGFLGCKNNVEYDYSYLAKILCLLPSKLLIYGKEDKIVNNMLDTMGIDFKYYIDFHRLYKKEMI